MNNKFFILFFFVFLFSIPCFIVADTDNNSNNSTIPAVVKTTVERKVTELDNELKIEFKRVYGNWIESCAKEFPLSSDTRDCRKASGYQELKNMGNKVIPLYIDLMLNSGDFFALVPYDEVQNNNHLIVQHKFLKSEQMRAIETIIMWTAANIANIICQCQ